MNVLVTGAKGQLGFDVVNELKIRGHRVIESDILEINEEDYVKLDITNENDVLTTFKKLSPDAVIHCAAWTNVDDAELEHNKEKVFLINSKGTEYVAKSCKVIGAKMIYVSTDYVFNGLGTEPWDEENQGYEPINTYGQSKLDGEKAVVNNIDNYYIVRVAWVFGVSGSNFVKTMLNISKKIDTIKVVNDQIGTPTYTLDLAQLLVKMTEKEKYGYYHVTNEGGFISWYDFACEILRKAGYENKVIPVTTEEYGLSRANRPKNSRLEKKKLSQKGFDPLPTWQDALNRYLKEIL